MMHLTDSRRKFFMCQIKSWRSHIISSTSNILVNTVSFKYLKRFKTYSFSVNHLQEMSWQRQMFVIA